MRLLAISGSLRRDSHNARLLRAAAHALPPEVELGVYEGLEDVPAFNQDRELDKPPAAAGFVDAIGAADGVLFATPEYNSSIPGALKNALDWASRPFPDNALRNKPVAVIGASTGMFGAVWAQAELRKVLAASGARVVDRELPVGGADGAFRDDDRLADDDLHWQLADLLVELHGEAERHAAARSEGAAA